MELRSNNHSVFRLNYHLIMCVKYRNKVITDEISDSLKQIFERIGPGYNIALKEWNHDKDHVHCLIEGHPNSLLSKFINAYKVLQVALSKKNLQAYAPHFGKNIFGLNHSV